MDRLKTRALKVGRGTGSPYDDVIYHDYPEPVQEIGPPATSYVAVEHHGTIVLVRPLTPEVRQWLADNTDGLWWGGALAVEPRYLDNLLHGLEELL